MGVPKPWPVTVRITLFCRVCKIFRFALVNDSCLGSSSCIVPTPHTAPNNWRQYNTVDMKIPFAIISSLSLGKSLDSLLNIPTRFDSVATSPGKGFLVGSLLSPYIWLHHDSLLFIRTPSIFSHWLSATVLPHTVICRFLPCRRVLRNAGVATISNFVFPPEQTSRLSCTHCADKSASCCILSTSTSGSTFDALSVSSSAYSTLELTHGRFGSVGGGGG